MSWQQNITKIDEKETDKTNYNENKKDNELEITEAEILNVGNKKFKK